MLEESQEFWISYRTSRWQSFKHAIRIRATRLDVTA